MYIVQPKLLYNAASTALPSFSHDQHHETYAAKQKGGLTSANN